MTAPKESVVSEPGDRPCWRCGKEVEESQRDWASPICLACFRELARLRLLRPQEVERLRYVAENLRCVAEAAKAEADEASRQLTRGLHIEERLAWTVRRVCSERDAARAAVTFYASEWRRLGAEVERLACDLCRDRPKVEGRKWCIECEPLEKMPPEEAKEPRR